jgi:hypothetical protein
MSARAARTRILAAVAALIVLAATAAAGAEDLPYLGSWSNGRGETLVITAKTIRFGEDRALGYKDVTRATDGSSFELQITARGGENAFGGNTLGVECDGDSMKVRAYRSHAEYMQEADPQSVVTWFKDDSEEAEE